MENVHHLPPSGNMTPSQALEFAERDFADLESVISLGMDKDGKIFTLSSHLTKERALWILEKAKFQILASEG